MGNKNTSNEQVNEVLVNMNNFKGIMEENLAESFNDGLQVGCEAMKKYFKEASVKYIKDTSTRKAFGTFFNNIADTIKVGFKAKPDDFNAVFSFECSDEVYTYGDGKLNGKK